MKKKLLALLLCACLLLPFAACMEVDVLDEQNMDEIGEAQYTIMVYLCGSDLETRFGMASDDLKEMINATYNREDIHVVVQTGGAKLWWNNGIPDEPARFLVKENGVAKLEELDARSMVDPETLTDFINYSMDNFPAERYGLIMWDHGAGSVWGFGSDEYYGTDDMSLAELYSALKNSRVAEQKLEFLGFDACLMATLETAYVVRDFAKYFIASEELEPGTGWAYDEWLTMLGEEPDLTGDEIGRIIVDTYINYFVKKDRADENVTLSCIDTSRVGSVVTALDAFVAVANLKNHSYQDIARPRANTKVFGEPTENGFSYDLVDIVHLAGQYESICPAEAKSLIAAVNSAVVHNGKGEYVENAGGLALFFPYAQKDWIPEWLDIYKTTGFSPNYINFCVEFSNKLLGAAITSMEDVGGYTPEPSPDNEGEYIIQLTRDDINNMASIYFTGWMHIEDDLYMQLVQHSNVDIASDGTITTEYDGLVTAIGGEPVCMYEIEKGKNYTRYGVSAKLNGEDVTIIVLVDDESPDGRILGALPVPEPGSMAPKNMLSIKKDDKLAFYYYCEEFGDIGSDLDALADPFWYEGDEITVGSKLEVETWEVPAGEYLYGFTIYDLQGNEYYTDFIVLEFLE